MSDHADPWAGQPYLDDIAVAKRLLNDLPGQWDGKACVLEMKEADYNWKQMEWWAFYFELKAGKLLASEFTIPGERIDGRVTFDARRTITWDFKSHAIKTHSHEAILNDVEAIDFVLERDGAYGLMVAMCDVEYNDDDRSFQKWHTALKGGLSPYEVERKARTSTSRYRKTAADLQEILFLVVTPDNREALGIMKQGRNSNGKPRPPKYRIDLEEIDPFLVDRLALV